MRTNAIIRIILFSLAIVVLLSILGVGIAAKWYMFDSEFEGSGNGNVSSTGTADADSVRNLSIEWAAGSITIRPADVSELTFTESGTEDHEPMVWLQSGDTLKISWNVKKLPLNYGNIIGKDLLIEIPRDWNCVELEVETASSDLIVDDLIIETVEFDGASGDFTFHNCQVGILDVDTASGDIHFTGTLNTLECDAASADCKLVLSNIPGRIDMDMASGDLDLSLPEDAGFTVSMETLSGNVDSEFEITSTHNGFTHGNGACRIDISAVSGDVYIRKTSEAKNCDH